MNSRIHRLKNDWADFSKLTLGRGRRIPKPMDEVWQKRHLEAVAQGLDFYQDPATGYFVMTELALKKRGHCCGNGCRHCPYPGAPSSAVPRPPKSSAKKESHE